MTTLDSTDTTPKSTDETLRPHSFDGIQEYDKRLPRWWLLTLHGAIVFAVIYWGYFHTYGVGVTPAVALQREMAENAVRASQTAVIDDEALWKMSREAGVVAAGKVTFDTTCAACHKPDLSGLIGPNLVDNQWIHGHLPLNAVKVIHEGILAKGMPAWGPILGKQKTNEVVAYIFSHHKPGEEFVAVPGWTPPGIPPPPPQ